MAAAELHTEVEGPEVGEGFVDAGPPKYVHGAAQEHGRVVIALGRRVRLARASTSCGQFQDSACWVFVAGPAQV
jgi:hypothetical protein